MRRKSAPRDDHRERALDAAAWSHNAALGQFDQDILDHEMAECGAAPHGERLAAELYDRTFTMLEWSLGGAIARHRDAPLRTVRTFVGSLLNPGRPELAAPGCLGRLPAPDRERFQRRTDVAVARLGAVLDEGRSRGQLRCAHTDVCARLVLTMALWLPAAIHVGGQLRGPSRRSLADGFAYTLLYGRAADRFAALPAPGANLWRGLTDVRPTPRGLAAMALRLNTSGVGTQPSHDASMSDLLMLCHLRTIDVFHSAMSEASAVAPAWRGVLFLRRLCEAYLSANPPLGPQLGLAGLPAADVAALRIRWRALRGLMHDLRRELLAIDQVRDRFCAATPAMMWALFAALSSGLWDEVDAEIASHAIADLLWLGFAPIAQSADFSSGASDSFHDQPPGADRRH